LTGTTIAPLRGRVRISLVTRVVLTVAALALAATGLLYGATWWTVSGESDAALARGVDVEIAALSDIYATGGERELVARIGDRLAMRAQEVDQTHYLLANGSGGHIAGDIAHWPLLSAENSQSGFVTLADGTPVFARATQLAPGLRVIAAREYDGRRRLLARIGQAFALAGLAIVAAALALAWLTARRLRRRVDAVNRAFRGIEQGDLQRLVPGAARRDELGELADHANHLIRRLAALIEAQREVTDQVAHEIRTPLAHLDAHLLRLIDRSVDPVLVEGLAEMRGEARGIAEMLDSLLDIAASEARRGDRTGLERIDLSALAAEVGELYAGSAEELGFDLHMTIAPDVTLAGDAMQLTRLLSNLLDNAFKYAGLGARIELIVEPGPRIVVRDNGPGVPEAMRGRIFDRFQRGAGAGKGHGLGLALVRAIARRHGLSVACEDAAPGAAFILEPERGA
jgi:signal transduction histidine kinase